MRKRNIYFTFTLVARWTVVFLALATVGRSQGVLSPPKNWTYMTQIYDFTSADYDFSRDHRFNANNNSPDQIRKELLGTNILRLALLK
jgi:hypothetical protein